MSVDALVNAAIAAADPWKGVALLAVAFVWVMYRDARADRRSYLSAITRVTAALVKVDDRLEDVEKDVRETRTMVQRLELVLTRALRAKASERRAA